MATAMMQFDTSGSGVGQYVDEDGTPVPDAVLRTKVDNYITKEQNAARKQALLFLAGGLTLLAFFGFMRKRIKLWHTVAATLAFGGIGQMNPARQNFIDNIVRSELQYLNGMQRATEASVAAAARIAQTVQGALLQGNGFTVEIERVLMQSAPSQAIMNTARIIQKIHPGLDLSVVIEELTSNIDIEDVRQLMGGTLPARAAQYTEAAYSTYQNARVALGTEAGIRLARRACQEDEESCNACLQEAERSWVDLASIPVIGSLTCRSNCRCYVEFMDWQKTKRFNPSEARDEQVRWTNVAYAHTIDLTALPAQSLSGTEDVDDLERTMNKVHFNVDGKFTNESLRRKTDWAKSVDRTNPIGVSIASDGTPLFNDGHHRVLAARILDKNVTVKIIRNALNPEVYKEYVDRIQKGFSVREINPGGWDLNNSGYTIPTANVMAEGKRLELDRTELAKFYASKNESTN